MILWAAITGSCAVLFLLTKLVTPQNAPNESSNLIVIVLLLMSFAIFALSFAFKKKFLEEAIHKQSLAGVQTALIVAWAMCEAICLFGLVAFFAFASPYHYAFFIVGAVGLLLHFPKRSHLHDAAHRR
jgi:F0F1-type ATP synthase membrane subunit c/vacuolar-type H+-ATPase subunit K